MQYHGINIDPEGAQLGRTSGSDFSDSPASAGAPTTVSLVANKKRHDPLPSLALHRARLQLGAYLSPHDASPGDRRWVRAVHVHGRNTSSGSCAWHDAVPDGQRNEPLGCLG